MFREVEGEIREMTEDDWTSKTPDEPCTGYSNFLQQLADNLNNPDKTFKKLYCWKKSEFFKEFPDKAPDWLADEFNIMWIKHSDLIPEGYQLFTPYEISYINYPIPILDNETKYDEVIMWRHKEEGCINIDLTGRHFLSGFITEEK